MTVSGELTGTRILPQGMGRGNTTRNRPGPGADDSRVREVRAMKRRTEITIETERVLLISRRRRSAVAWCEACGGRVLMLTTEEAARQAGVTARILYRRVEAGQVHFTETADGALLICCTSLHE